MFGKYAGHFGVSYHTAQRHIVSTNVSWDETTIGTLNFKTVPSTRWT